MKAIAATFIILFATGAAAQFGRTGSGDQGDVALALITDVSVSVTVNDDDGCGIRADGLKDEAELGLRRSGIQVADHTHTHLTVWTVTVNPGRRLCAAATNISLETIAGNWPALVWTTVYGPFLGATTGSERYVNQRVRDTVREQVVSISNAILEAREKLPGCHSAALLQRDDRDLWERCLEERRQQQ